MYPKLKPQASSNKMIALKTLFIGEAALFFVAYYFYHKMNTRRDFRLEMYKNHKWALDLYYKVGKLGGIPTKEVDYEYWGIKDDETGSSR